MNKKIVIIVLVLLLAFGAYFFLNKGKSVSNSKSQAQSQKSLKDLLSAGIAQKCTFSDTSDSSSQEGITYVSKGKMRGDFTTTTSGKVLKSHMIVVDNTSYIWTDEDKNGFKSTFSEPDSSKATDDKTPSDSVPTSVDVDKQADYKCSAWVVDDSVFTPPVDIKFSDLSEMFKGAEGSPANGSGTGSSSQCSVCDSLSGDDKSQCKTALNCN